MDSWSDPEVRQVTLVGSSQFGKTTVVENCIGHTIDIDPCAMLVIHQNARLAASFSRERIDPMVRDNPRLRAKVAVKKSRDSNNTLAYKAFTSGFLALGSAEVSGDLAGRPIPKAIGEEVDRWSRNSSNEGNPIEILRRRQVTFWDSKLLINSTPTNLATSLIWPEWQRSNRQYYHLPCPSCGAYHKIEWENLKWSETSPGVVDPATAAVECPHCGARYDSVTRTGLLPLGKWIADNPEATDHHGYFIWAAYASWVELADIVKAYLRSKDDYGSLQVFWNTTLGLPWEGSGATIEWEDVYSRRTPFEADIPDWVVAVFVGVDTQDDRFECTACGVGVDDDGDERSVVIDHSVLSGDPAEQDTRNKLDTYILQRGWPKPDGTVLYALAAAIDTQGHRADDVYAYCRPRGRVQTDHGVVKIIGIIGRAGDSRPLLGRPVQSKKGRRDRRSYRPWIAGVDGAKSKIYLALSKTEDKGRLFIPRRSPFDEEYCKGLTGEELIVDDKRKLRWVPRAGRRRNEPLDCLVYAMVAQRHWGGDIKRLAATLKAKKKEPDGGGGGSGNETPAKRRPPRRRPGGWVNGWR
jgi:phage terminase large subunit GpA-like protein